MVIDEQNFEIPTDYNEIFKYQGFYLEVGELGKLCTASFDYLEYQLENIKQNITDKENIIPSELEEILEKHYSAKEFDIE